MLTRTNLTLSALSNRLNLGTRSLVLNTGVNNGMNLRIRQAHHDVMRKFKAAFKVGDPVVAAPPIIDPAIWEAPRSAWDSKWSADASPRSSSRSRAAARATDSATSPRLGRGVCRLIVEVGAAWAASRRTAVRVARATTAVS